MGDGEDTPRDAADGPAPPDSSLLMGSRRPRSYAEALNTVAASGERSPPVTLPSSRVPPSGSSLGSGVAVDDTLLAREPRSSSGIESGSGVASAGSLAPISGREATLIGSGQHHAEPGPPRTPAPPREMPAKIGRYLVIERLGEGGMGVVFAAYDPQLDRKVAIKLVRPAYTETSGSEAQSRLVREAQALARLRHPNIVTVYEVGAFGDEVYVAMEFVDGITLRTWQFEQARSWRDILRVYQAAGRGLAAAHRVGLVHRDFKPDNVLVTPEGEARVLDFGLAFRDPVTAAVSAAAATMAAGELTMTGALVGTPAYMSPEQHRGQTVDVRTDVFAFAVSLFEALYGTRPYAGTTLAEITTSLLIDGKIAPPPAFIKIPAWLRRVVHRGLRIDPKERYQDMEAVLRALGRDPMRYLAIAVGVAVVTGVIVSLALALRSAEGRQSLRDQGARARADFDHRRAAALEVELARGHGRAAEEQFNRWVIEAARVRLETTPSDALAALRHLRLDGGGWAAARGVVAEAQARGVPTSAWATDAAVAAVTFAEEGRWVVTGDAGGRVEVRAREGGAVAAGVMHRAGISGLGAAVVAEAGARPGLRVVAVADGEALLWDVASDVNSRVGGEGGEGGRVRVAALAPDGSRVAVGTADGRVRIHGWTGEVIGEAGSHAAGVGAMAWADDETLVSGGEDGAVVLWTPTTGARRELGTMSAAVRELWLPEPTRLFGVAADRRGVMWRIDDGQLSAVDIPDVRAVRAGGRVRLQLDPRGAVKVLGEDGAARGLAVAADARAVDLDASGRWAAVGHARGVEVWDVEMRRGRVLADAGARLRRIAWSPDGRWIAGTTESDGLQLWHAENGGRRILRATGPAIEALFFTAEDRLVAADGRPRVIAWDLRQDPPVERDLPVIGAARSRVAARPLADGGLLQWAADADGVALQALTADGVRRWTTAIRDEVAFVALSPDGRQLATAGRQGRAGLWRVEGEVVRREAIEVGGAEHRWQAVAHDGDSTRTRLAAALEREGGIAGFEVWEVAWDEVDGATPTPHLLYEDAAARDVLRDEAGESVVVLGRESLHLWQLASGAIDRLPGCAGELQGFALARGRRQVALVGSRNGKGAADTVCFVELADGSFHRLGLGGEPWAWDGRRRFASVVEETAIELWTDTTPEDPEALLRWLEEHAPRELSLTALAGRRP